MNADWHRDHVLGSGASLDRRVSWHVQHAKECGCRPIPDPVRREIEARALDRRKAT